MNKQGPLTKVEKFYIENNIEVDPAMLAKDLSRSITIVRHYVEDVKEISEQPKPKGNVVQTRPNEKRDGFARRKASIVSTQTASEKGEGMRKFKKNKRDGLYKPFSE